MLRDFLAGIGYLLRGFTWLGRPGLRRYVVAPVLASALVFAVLVVGGAYGYDRLMAALLPAGWGWLEVVLWPLYALAAAMVFVFAFLHLASLVAAPFNDLLAERVFADVTGAPPPEGGWVDMVRDAGGAVINAARVLVYSLGGAAALLLLSLVPVLNLLAGPLWLAFNAWLVALEYHDFPLGNRRLAFPEQRRLLGQHRTLALGFGAAGVVALAVPGLNLLAMPAAVIGATHLAHERLPLGGAARGGPGTG